MRLKTLTNVVMLLLCGTQVFSQALNETVKDVCGNTYKVVQIGYQTWMAENLRCNKYDTKSEAYNATWLKNNTFPESTEPVVAPFYVDATDRDNHANKGESFTDEDMTKLGYLYNESAALGFENGYTDIDAKNIRKMRQGICPNGWHIPSAADYGVLRRIEGDSCVHLKSQSGWVYRTTVGDFPRNGLDTYGFNAYPAGCGFCGGAILDAGTTSNFWTVYRFDNSFHCFCISPNFDTSATLLINNNLFNDLLGSVRCIMDETLKVSPSAETVETEGGSFDAKVTSNVCWTARSNKEWAMVSVASGCGDQTVKIQVEENETTMTDQAAIIFTTEGGTKTDTVTITRKGKEKCNADEYPQVKIGNQIWMAENYRCSKYDTESEAYKAGMLTIPMIEKNKEYSNEELIAAYFEDASDKTLWNQTDDKIKQLTNSEVEKFGYLYNWSATMGMTTDEAANASGPFHNRQGICPNGWHVPDESDWNRLFSYQYFPTSSLIPTHLKSETGWAKMYDGTDVNGINDTRFSILPAGSVDGNKTNRNVGYSAWFWTSDTKSSNSAKYMEFESGTYILKESNRKTLAKSVRCLKNEETLNVSPSAETVETEGGSFDAKVTSNVCWTARSDKEWATVSVANGCGDQTVKIQVEENETTMTDQAAIIFTTEGGTKTDTVTITRKGKEKCNADEYPQVKIGNQIWMAENYRCSKYDTESEAYKAGMLTVPMIEKGHSNEDLMAAYYIDAADTTTWVIFNNDEGTLSNAQFSKFGYRYNWVATVGLQTNNKQIIDDSKTHRQGICPNGWHVPSYSEYITLFSYLSGDTNLKATCLDDINQSDLISKLITETGWGTIGTNSSNFALLPAGYYFGTYFKEERQTSLQTSSSYDDRIVKGFSLWEFKNQISNLEDAYRTYGGKEVARSVRCLKNEEVPADDSDVVSGPVIANVNSGASVPCKDIIINAKVTSTCKLKEVTLHYKNSKSEGGYQSVPMNGTDDDLYTGKIDAGVTVNGTINYYIDATDTNGRHGIYGDSSSPEHIDVNQTATLSTSGSMTIEIGNGMTTDCRPMDDGTTYRAYFKSVCNGSEYERWAGDSEWNEFLKKEILTIHGNTNGDTSLKNGFNEGEDIIIKAVNGDNQEYVLNGHGLTYSTVAKTKTLDRGNACSGQSQLEVSQYMVDYGECDNSKTVTLRLTAYGCEEISIKSVSLEKKDKFSYFSIPEFKERTISCGETIEIPVTYVPTEDDENCLVIEYYERETPVSVTVTLTGKSKRKSMCSGISINKGLLNTDGTLSGTLQVGNSTHIEMSLKSKCNKNAEELLNGVYDGTQGFSAAGKLSEGDYKITIYTNDKVCEYFFNVKK